MYGEQNRATAGEGRGEGEKGPPFVA